MSGFAVNGNLAELAIETQSAVDVPASAPAYSHQLFSGRAAPAAQYANIDVTDISTALPMVWKTVQDGVVNAVIPAFPGSIGKYIKGILPTDTKTGASDPWTHTFDPSGSAVYETFFGTMPGPLYERFDNGVISEVVFAFGDDKLLKVTVTGFCKTSTRLASVYTPVVAEIIAPTAEFLHTNGAIFKFTVGATPATDVVDNIQSGTLTIARPVNPVPTADTFLTNYFNRGRLNVSADLTFVYKDNAYYNSAFYGGPTGTTPSATVPSASLDFKFPCLNNANHDLQIKMPWLQMQVDAPEPNVDGSEHMLHVICSSIRPTSGTLVSVVVRNGVTSAY